MNKTEPKIAVLVLGYNHRAVIGDALRSASRQTYKNCIIFFIDNASHDGSSEYVRTNFSQVIVKENTVNKGYAGAYAAELVECFAEDFEAAVLLNPDTVVSETWLEELVESAFASESIALAQPKIFLWQQGPTGLFNTCGNHINFLGFGYCGCYKKKDEPAFRQDRFITFASGACLLIKKNAYRKLWGLDTDFFAYLEDQDLGWQAHLLGYQNIVSARSVMWHKYDFRKKHLDDFKFYLLERNRLTFLLKYFEWKTLALIFPAFIIMEIGILGVSILDGYFLGKLRGYRYNMQYLARTLRKRALIQQARQKSDSELFSLLSADINFLEVQSFLLTAINCFLRVYYVLIARILKSTV